MALDPFLTNSMNRTTKLMRIRNKLLVLFGNNYQPYLHVSCKLLCSTSPPATSQTLNASAWGFLHCHCDFSIVAGSPHRAPPNQDLHMTSMGQEGVGSPGMI